MEKRRSRGVTIIGRIIVVFAYLSLLKAIYALGMILFYKQGSKAGYLVSFYPNLFPYGIDEINGAKEFNKIFSVFISIMFTSSILLLSSGIGILKLKDWGRKLLLISYPSIYILRIIMKISGYKYASIMYASKMQLLHYVIPLLIMIFIYYFFTRPKVKEQFKQP